MKKLAIALAVAALLAAVPAAAQHNYAPDGALCFGSKPGTDEQVVIACLSIVHSPIFTDSIYLAYYDLGRAYQRMGKYVDAQTSYLYSIKARHDYVAAWQGYGEAGEKLGQAGLVMSSLNQAIAANPINPKVYNDVCWVRAVLNQQLDVAIADCNESLRLDPSNKFTLDSRCFANFRKADYINAVADCDAALKLDSTLPSSLYVRGLAKLRLGYAQMGQADIAAATAIDANIAKTYAAYGVTP